jgi:hypothetical protein
MVRKHNRSNQLGGDPHGGVSEQKWVVTMNDVWLKLR